MHACVPGTAAPCGVVQAALESLALQNVGCSIHACRAVLELLTHSQVRAALPCAACWMGMKLEAGRGRGSRRLHHAECQGMARLRHAHQGLPVGWHSASLGAQHVMWVAPTLSTSHEAPAPQDWGAQRAQRVAMQAACRPFTTPL